MLDGSTVPPDKFIKLVEQGGRTRQFTKIMIDKAYAELSAHIDARNPSADQLQHFPARLGQRRALEMFSSFTAARERFDVAGRDR